MSFKVIVKGKDKLFSDIEKALNNSLKLTIMQSLGAMAREIIYNRTKSGKGLNSDSIESPSIVSLASLSRNYVKYRSKLQEKGFTFGSFASARKTNLTLTGQMLEAIKVEARRNGFLLDIDESARSDSRLNNKQVARYAGEKRPFFALSNSEQTILFRELENKLRAELRKSLGSRSVRA